MRTFLAALTAVAVTTSACGGCGSPVDDPSSTVPGRCSADVPGIVPQKTDILFVIDNSGSMAEEQDAIARELPAFIDVLRQGGGVAQDFHVAVLNTSVYRNANINGTITLTTYPGYAGTLQVGRLPDGGTPPGGERVIQGEDPQLIEKFQTLINQGTTGSGQETPFEAVWLALLGPQSRLPVSQGGTQGFLRDGAQLLIVMVTDEDDCSEQVRPPTVVVGTDVSRDYCFEQASKLTPVATYSAAFRSLLDSTGAPRPVLWAAIAPVALSDKRAQLVVEGGQARNVDCPNSYGPGYRHREMALSFDAQGLNLDSICNQSYREGLIQIAALANVNQRLEVANVPDPGLLQISITRKDGTVQRCTYSNGDFSWTQGSDEQPGSIVFGASCLRRADDQGVALKMLCAG